MRELANNKRVWSKGGLASREWGSMPWLVAERLTQIALGSDCCG
jgi:hypothetical protein